MLRGLRVFHDFSTVHVRQKRRISKRRCHARRIRITVYDTGGRNDVSVFQGYSSRDSSHGKCSPATFRTLSDDDLFYSRLWGVCRGECVYGWFMESEGNFYVRLLYSKWVDKSWNTFECWIRMMSSFTLDVSFYVEYLILRLLRSL